MCHQVHPNSKRPAHFKLKHYEFAGRIVGKCLYESAVGQPLMVTARFSRSFLAQIIGLRINHKVSNCNWYTCINNTVHVHTNTTVIGIMYSSSEFLFFLIPLRFFSSFLFFSSPHSISRVISQNCSLPKCNISEIMMCQTWD